MRPLGFTNLLLIRRPKDFYGVNVSSMLTVPNATSAVAGGQPIADDGLPDLDEP